MSVPFRQLNDKLKFEYERIIAIAFIGLVMIIFKIYGRGSNVTFTNFLFLFNLTTEHLYTDNFSR